jgi:signal transduction histidine kinase
VAEGLLIVWLAGALRRARERVQVSLHAAEREIAERHRVEEERAELLVRERAARADAEAANRAKDVFLAMVSHELRAPLGAILTWTAVLRKTRPTDEAFARGLDTIDQNTRLQSQLIEDLLDVSRIVTGKLRLDFRPVDLASVVEMAIDTIRPAAEAQGIRLKSGLDPLAGSVQGDRDRLQQVAGNLLSNALKHSPGGEVEVRLEESGTWATLTVRDTGAGIPPHLLPDVFEPFVQGADPACAGARGLGLGLAIVHHLVERHGGTVHAASPGQGLGSTFTVRLPKTGLRRDPPPPDLRSAGPGPAGVG